MIEEIEYRVGEAAIGIKNNWLQMDLQEERRNSKGGICNV